MQASVRARARPVRGGFDSRPPHMVVTMAELTELVRGGRGATGRSAALETGARGVACRRDRPSAPRQALRRGSEHGDAAADRGPRAGIFP